MTLTDLQTLIGSLCNDSAHERYALTDINTELDNSQSTWNVEAKIIKATTTVAVVDGTRRYALTNLTGTPIAFPRATLNGLDITKRSKAWLDLYSGTDWTASTGTPTDYIIEATDPNNLYLTLYRTPTSVDAGNTLVVEYILAHTSMSASTDVPFMQGTFSNYLLRPYDWGLAYLTAARLLARDVTKENAKKQSDYARIGANVMADVIQVFKALEAEEPKRFKGGRYWKSGNIKTSK